MDSFFSFVEPASNTGSLVVSSLCQYTYVGSGVVDFIRCSYEVPYFEIASAFLFGIVFPASVLYTIYIVTYKILFAKY